MAIKLGVEAFKVYLVGRPFTIQTDHRSLKWLNRLKDKNSCLTRWSLALQAYYTFEVEHRAETPNSNADALSCCATDKKDTSVAGEEGRSVSVSEQTILCTSVSVISIVILLCYFFLL